MISKITFYLSVLLFLVWNMFPQATDAQSLPIHYAGVVFDNDDHRDTYTEEMLMLAEHLGILDLKAVMTTYKHREYPTFVTGREEIRQKAIQANLRVDYTLFSGTNHTLTVPASGRIADTEPLDIAGSRFIVKEAKKATSEAPLAVLTGGQLTSVANAYLLDSTIADRVIVVGLFGAPDIDYNANLDAWAWVIILAKLNVVSFKFRETNGDFGRAFLQMPLVPKNRLKETLPFNVFTQWMIDKRHPSQPLPQKDADGHALAALLDEHYISAYRRWSFQRIDPHTHHPVLVADPKGKVYEILDADQAIGSKAYWDILTSYAQEK